MAESRCLTERRPTCSKVRHMVLEISNGHVPLSLVIPRKPAKEVRRREAQAESCRRGSTPPVLVSGPNSAHEPRGENLMGSRFRTMMSFAVVRLPSLVKVLEVERVEQAPKRGRGSNSSSQRAPGPVVLALRGKFLLAHGNPEMLISGRLVSDVPSRWGCTKKIDLTRAVQCNMQVGVRMW